MEVNKISVLIPVHNMGYAIGRALKSLVNQTNQSFDVVIALDDCTDNTESVINDYEDRLNITYFNVFYKNVGKVRDELIDHLNTDLYTFLDADDELTPYAIEEALNIPKEAYFMRFGKIAKGIDGTETRYKPYMMPQFLHGVIFKRSAIAKYGVRFGALDLNEDVSYLGRLVLSVVSLNNGWLETLSDKAIYIQYENERSATHTAKALHFKMQTVEAYKQIYRHFKSLCRNPKEQSVLIAMGMVYLMRWGYEQRKINKNLSPLRFMRDEVERYSNANQWNNLLKMYLGQQIGDRLIMNEEAEKTYNYFKL